jgi:hypothetical protein
MSFCAGADSRVDLDKIVTPLPHFCPKGPFAMFRRPVAALSCVVLFALAVPAAAAPVTLSPTDTTPDVNGRFDVHNVYGRTTVTIQSGATSQRVSAGAFDVTSSAAIPGLGSMFAAWCLDIGRYLSLPSQYDVTSTPFTGNVLTPVQRGAITALFNIASAWDFSNNAKSAGFQLALWEVVNEAGGVFSLTNDLASNADTFFVTSTGNASNSAVTEANGLLGQLAGYDPKTALFRVVYLQSQDTRPNDGYNRDSQNLAALAPVPVPAAGALLLAALAGLGLARRRQVRNS